MDIRQLIKANRDKVFTSAGDQVEITDLEAGPRGKHIRGNVIRGKKEIPHWWQSSGLFSHNPNSPLTLIVKTDEK